MWLVGFVIGLVLRPFIAGYLCGFYLVANFIQKRLQQQVLLKEFEKKMAAEQQGG